MSAGARYAGWSSGHYDSAAGNSDVTSQDWSLLLPAQNLRGESEQRQRAGMTHIGRQSADGGRGRRWRQGAPLEAEGAAEGRGLRIQRAPPCPIGGAAEAG